MNILTMIVKNEAPVLRRCLEAAKPHIDAWAILDTGSTDDTENVVLDALGGLPGQLEHADWTGFGAARTEAFRLAERVAWAHEFHEAYALVIDADEAIVVPPGFVWPTEHDAHGIRMGGAVGWWQLRRFSLARRWRYEGVLHEYPTTDGEWTEGSLPGVFLVPGAGGARSRNPEKYRHDAEILEAALKDDPKNSRNVFYCAQSWRDAGEPEKAREWYLKRAEMGGWDEEVYVALLEAAKATPSRKSRYDTRAAYVRAVKHRPSRAEALCALARYERFGGCHREAWDAALAAVEIPMPDDKLFVDASVYQWLAKDELALAAYNRGHMTVARALNESLLAGGTLPPHEVERIRRNLAACQRP